MNGAALCIAVELPVLIQPSEGSSRLRGAPTCVAWLFGFSCCDASHVDSDDTVGAGSTTLATEAWSGRSMVWSLLPSSLLLCRWPFIAFCFAIKN